jgi:hypothetical protein
VKYFLFVAGTLAFGQFLAFGQSTVTSYSTDLNGNRVAGSSIVSKDGEHTRITQSINGRQVPAEQTEERVISESSAGRVVEKITKHFDQNGAVASTDRTVTEEQKVPNGSVTHSTTYRSDVNGQMHESERRTVESRTQGSSATTQIEIARPDLSGSFQTAEKRSLTSETANNTTHTDETVYRRAENGGFYPAVRDVSDTTQNGPKAVEKSAHYEQRDGQQLQLMGQTVSTTVKQPDGSSVSEVNLYGANAEDGRAHDNQTGLHLREQQTVEHIPGPGGSVTEIVTARRPTISDPSHLGPSTKISETVCTGKCSDSKP